MFGFSFRHRLQKDFDSALDTFLFRTIFLVGIVCQAVPEPFSKSRSRALYLAIVLVAFALNGAVCVIGFVQGVCKRARQAAYTLKKLECRVEFCLKAKHFAIILLAAGLAILVLAGFCP